MIIISTHGLVLKSLEIIYAGYLIVPQHGVITPSIASAPPALPSVPTASLAHFALVAPARASTGTQAGTGVICPAACPRVKALMKILIVMHNHEESKVKLLWEPLCD